MSVLKTLFAASSAVWLLLANTSLEAPRLGYVLLENHEIWSVRGVAGAFYLGQFMAGAVDQHEFNGIIGVRTSGPLAELLGPNGEIFRRAVLDGSKVRHVGISYLEDAAYVLTGTELWRVDRDRADRFMLPELMAMEVEALTHADRPRVAGISGAGGYIELAIVSQGQVLIKRLWIASGESLVLETFNGTPEHFVFLANGMSVWTEDGFLVLRRPDGSTVRIETDSQFTALHQIGKGLLQATASDGRQFAIQLTGTPLEPEQMSMRLLRLPGEAVE